MQSTLSKILFGLAGLLLLAAQASAAGAIRVPNAIWAADHLFGTVVTPTSFIAPPEHSVDTLYNFSMSGLQGQHSVSESYPGSPDFNGGRWSVKIAVFTASGMAALDANNDGTIDAEITNSTDLLAHVTAGHIEVMDTTIYFECPMLP